MPSTKSATTQPRLVIVGDVAFETADPVETMSGVTRYMQDSAIAFANCEWPLTTRGEPWPGKAGRVVRSSPDKIAGFAGFDAVTLANNHVMNYGAEGLLETLDVLDAAGIAHCGAGRDLEQAHKPAFVEACGKRIAFLGYTSVFAPGFEAARDRPGMAVVRVETRYRAASRLHEMPGSPMEIETVPDAADVELLLDDIGRAASQADYVVVAWHWGVSMGYRYLVPYQVDLGRAAIDAGADLVVGHHPHTLQGIELHKGKVIAHSIAHCGFDMAHDSLAQDAVLVEVPLDRPDLGDVLVRPLGDALVHPTILDRRTGASCIARLEALSHPLGTDLVADGTAVRAVPAGRPFSRSQAFGMFCA